MLISWMLSWGIPRAGVVVCVGGGGGGEGEGW